MWKRGSDTTSDCSAAHRDPSSVSLTARHAEGEAGHDCARLPTLSELVQAKRSKESLRTSRIRAYFESQQWEEIRQPKDRDESGPGHSANCSEHVPLHELTLTCTQRQ